MIIASALIEVYVRGLVVRYSEEAQKKWSRKVEAEQELESMRKLSFGKLLDHLVGVGLFLAKDSQQAKTIYRDIRIPTHHGLPSRLLGRDKGDSLFSIMTLCGLSSSVSMSDFESFVEEEALTVVNNIVSIIERNQFGVDRYG
ncbi:hypothetical protein [Thioalkalivibrio sp. ARh3]|uniref:hypothetical protein n=1 Tax=Thioalkalivibrio sp. ARh3 TaxID=1158148 RepID=UPI0012DE5451|nr:hypothetical protein [Thioalkalivibrio sp. ARh3]